MANMMALRAHERGGPEKLVYEVAPMPAPREGDVVIAVHAASLTFDEFDWDSTWERDGVDRTPTIPSHEVSGTVEIAGDGVTRFTPGDEVYGLTPFDRDGAAADFVAVPAAALARRPHTIDHTATAAVPLAGLTAWQALVEHGGVSRGAAVLIHGGAGGVGVFAVQIAHALGAVVTATARGRDLDFVRSLGADRVLDFERDAFDADGPLYDVVLDAVGGETLERSYAVVRKGGRLVTLMDDPSQEKAAEHGINAVFFVVEAVPSQLDELTALIEGGRLTVPIAAAYPLERGREAYESGSVHPRRPGKTVLVVRD